jgi:hypothetical protein
MRPDQTSLSPRYAPQEVELRSSEDVPYAGREVEDSRNFALLNAGAKSGLSCEVFSASGCRTRVGILPTRGDHRPLESLT